MKYRKLIFISSIFTIASCTSIQVEPLDPSMSISKVCIEKNPKVIVPQFLEILRSGFERHNIATKVYSGNLPETCKAILSYTALRSWDFSTYLSHAELWLRDHRGEQIGYAKYHLNAGGGFSLTKWSSAESKMNPVIDELLAHK